MRFETVYGTLCLAVAAILAGIATGAVYVGLGFESQVASVLLYIFAAWLDVNALALLVYGIGVIFTGR